MKKNNRKAIIISAVLFAVLIAAFAVIYGINKPKTNAGSKKIIVEVCTSDGNTTDYDLSTDAEYLIQAMDELAANGSGFSYSGSDSDYGIMIEEINGERAVYAEDNAYWALYVNSEYGQFGADAQPVTDGDTYAWKYEKAQ